MVEEKTTADGHHLRKEIHEEKGVLSMDVTRDDGGATMAGEVNGVAGMMRQVMDELPPLGPGLHKVQVHGELTPDPMHQG